MAGSDPNTNTTSVIFLTRLGCSVRLCDERQASEPQDRTFTGHMHGNANQSQKAPLPVRLLLSLILHGCIDDIV